MVTGHKTSAWPLALSYLALVLYASLYPFSSWRDQGIAPWSFLLAPFPQYWTGFDLIANVLGYGPLGFLLALTAQRTGRRAQALWLPVLACSALSLCMETLQSYLPSRVPSNVDWALNTLGATAGAVMAVALERLGAIDRWSRFRDRWFVEESRGALVLMALWPMALLYPAAVPLGLGQVLERLESTLAQALNDTPFLDWLPVREIELQPLVPGGELVCVLLGVLIPCLLGYSVTRGWRRRMLLASVAVLAGIAATTLSAALSYGPTHHWDWVSPPVRAGLVTGWLLALALVWLPRRSCAALLLLAVVLQLSLLNQAPTSAYFAQTLQTWEQGRFVRFNGLALWLGRLWPYAVVLYVLVRISSRDQEN